MSLNLCKSVNKSSLNVFLRSLPKTSLIIHEDSESIYKFFLELLTNIYEDSNLDKYQSDFLVVNNSKYVISDIDPILDFSYLSPIVKKTKVIFINNFTRSTEIFQTKFLKILEEPPENVIFILGCLSGDYLLDTIKSRSFVFPIIKVEYNLFRGLFEKDSKEESILFLYRCFYGSFPQIPLQDVFSIRENLLTLIQVSSADDIAKFLYFSEGERKSLKYIFNKYDQKSVFYIINSILLDMFSYLLYGEVYFNIDVKDDFKGIKKDFKYVSEKVKSLTFNMDISSNSCYWDTIELLLLDGLE